MLRAPDPEFVAEDKNEVEITDLDLPSKTGKVLGKFPILSQIPSFRARTWMSIAIIACIVLLVFTIQVNAPHVPKATKVNVQPVQINYPVSLSVVDGICYTNAPNGVVTAIRISDGVLLWRHVGGTTGEESATVVDGVIYLTPILPFDSHTTTMTVQALRARDGSSLWSRTFQTDSPETFQLTGMSKVVYIWTSAGRIDALRARDGSLLGTSHRVYLLSRYRLCRWSCLYKCSRWSIHGVASQQWHSALEVYITQSSPAVTCNSSGGHDIPEPARWWPGCIACRYWHFTLAIYAAFSCSGLYPQILVSDGVVYAGTLDHHLFALRASDGFKIWSVVPHATDDFFFMNVTDGAVYVRDASNIGIVDALRQSSGSAIWRYIDRSGKSVPITVAEGVVYLGSYTTGANILASITALRASDGVVLWSYTPHTSSKQLNVSGGQYYSNSLQYGSVDALYASNGSLLWQSA